ncbi:MAG TPA: DNA polymerase I [Candidatus Hydrogenedentes bacterium]|nr:DNA polymerase I [Candidatus Hydrogenedentota bacterium]HPG67127.1 DNA polymerase I [Candidatus Hydrogenedentota bacterium]
MADRLFLIDGTAFAFRSFYAIKSGLTDSRGRPTNAVFGFVRVLLKILRELEPSHIAVVFDAKGKSFRSELYPEYKAHRRATPPELNAQFPMMDEVVKALEIPILRVPGVEADDVMGTLARRAEAEGMETVIVTGDKDLLQLVTDKVRVYDPSRGDEGVWYSAAEVRERMGTNPERVIDALALMGDSSDNVPGVPGIGPKTARTLLETYGSLDAVYEHVAELKGKQREHIEANRDLAYLSRDLVTIRTDVEIEVAIEDCRTHDYDRRRLAEVFADLDFQSLVEEFLPDASGHENLRYTLILTREQLETAVAEMRAAGCFALDTETTSVDPMRAELVGVSLSCRAETGYYLPVGHAPEALMRRETPDDLFPSEVIAPLPKTEALEILRPLLEDPSIGKVGHNIKYDYIVLARAGIRVAGIVMDTMVASYLTDPSRFRHNLNEVSLHYLKRRTILISDLVGNGSKAVTFDTVPVDQACAYACEDADVTWRLAAVFDGLLEERQLRRLSDEVEIPLIGVLARMEMAGIALDVEVLAELQIEIEQRLGALEAAIFEIAGETFQINSPKQLQRILFDKLGLHPVRKTKTGYSTDVDVLEELAHAHPLPERVLEYRTLEKLRGTYVEALPKLVHPETKRIHTSFNQAIAATGRLSSSDPNLQNIPVRTELGRRIRRAFVPGGANRRLISADYSQIELRILAHLAGDESLRAAFRADADIHRETAARAFGVSVDAVTPEMRRQAKAVNFGIVYGISPYGLAKNLGVSTAVAARFIEQYFAQYPKVRVWIDQTVEAARADGYTVTLLNRRRYLPDLASSDTATRKAAERAAINTPVQGSAADVIKLAMIRLDTVLEGRDAQMLLQVHDELLVETGADDAPEVAQVMKAIMEDVVKLDVPLRVDVGIGDNWETIH